MKEIINKFGNVVKVYAETFEYEAYDQIKALSNFPPYTAEKIRIMPDAHAGKGCTVGTTMTISKAITPNLVGVDIGCGMLTIELNTDEITKDELQKLDDVINSKVPHGFNVHERALAKCNLEGLRCNKYVDLKRAEQSIGSLGGGNHFIEVGSGDGKFYLIIHSGSRKLGADTCKYYQDLAFQNSNEMKKVKENLIVRLKKEGRSKDIAKELKKVAKPITSKELAFLTGEDFNNYMHDMRIVQQYAVENRMTIAGIILKEMGWTIRDNFETIHNYIDFNRMILRKGAVSAEEGETLLIPINMRDGSLLCVGKGNEDWNYSAPHGAGRLMSRSKAKRELNIDDFVDEMKDVFTSSVSTSTLDEAPAAYKDMQEIIDCIKDTAELIGVIKPIYNFKSH